MSVSHQSPELPSEDTFEQVAVSTETFRKRGFEYMLVGVANQWTGLACEVLYGVLVYFKPFRKEKHLPTSEKARATECYS